MDWEERFDEKFEPAGMFKVSGTRDNIKDFIRKLLEEERKKLRWTETQDAKSWDVSPYWKAVENVVVPRTLKECADELEREIDKEGYVIEGKLLYLEYKLLDNLIKKWRGKD